MIGDRSAFVEKQRDAWRSCVNMVISVKHSFSHIFLQGNATVTYINDDISSDPMILCVCLAKKKDGFRKSSISAKLTNRSVSLRNGVFYVR